MYKQKILSVCLALCLSTFMASDVRAQFVAAHYDIDGDGSVGALTDGLLIIRHLFDLSGDALIQDAVASGATRTSATELATYLESIRSSALDVDGDGNAQALSDGLLIIRYLFDLPGDALIQDAINTAGAVRTTADEVIAFLESQQIKTGIFVDGQLSGNIGFETSSGLSGTLSAGEFQYMEGDTIKFFIGDLLLTTLPADSLLHIFQDNNGVNLAAFLQAIDKDNNPENGIEISEEMANLFNQEVDINVSTMDASDTAFQETFSRVTGRTLLPQYIAYQHAEKSLAIQLLKQEEAILYKYYTGSFISEGNGFLPSVEAQGPLLSSLSKRLDLYAYRYFTKPDILIRMNTIVNQDFDNINRNHTIITSAIKETSALAGVLFSSAQLAGGGYDSVVDGSLEKISEEASSIVEGVIKNAALSEFESKVPFFGGFSRRLISLWDACKKARGKKPKLSDVSTCTAEVTLQAAETAINLYSNYQYSKSLSEVNRLVVLQELLETYYELSGDWDKIAAANGFNEFEIENGVDLTLLIVQIAGEVTPDVTPFRIFFTPGSLFNIFDAVAVENEFKVITKKITQYRIELVKEFGFYGGYNTSQNSVAAGHVELEDLDIKNNGELKACYLFKNNTNFEVQFHYILTVDKGVSEGHRKTGVKTLTSQKIYNDCLTLQAEITDLATRAIELNVSLTVLGEELETFTDSKVVIKSFNEIDETLKLILENYVSVIYDTRYQFFDGLQELSLSADTRNGNNEPVSDTDYLFSWRQLSDHEIDYISSPDSNATLVKTTAKPAVCYVFEFTMTNKTSGSSDAKIVFVKADESAICESESEPSPEIISQLSFVGENLGNGTTVNRGQSYTKTWSFNNSGNQTLSIQMANAVIATGFDVSAITPSSFTLGVSEQKTLSVMINVPANAVAGEYFASWNIMGGNGYQIPWDSCFTVPLSFKFVVPKIPQLQGSLSAIKTDVQVDETVNFLVKMNTGAAPYSIVLNDGSGRGELSATTSVGADSIGVNIAYDVSGTYNITATVTDTQQQQSVYHLSVNVFDDPITETSWKGSGLDIGPSQESVNNLPISVSGDDYQIDWQPAEGGDNYFTQYSLSVPRNLISLERGVRLFVTTRGDLSPDYDREFTFLTSANKSYSAAIRAGTDGYTLIRDFITGQDERLPKAALTDQPANIASESRSFIIELTGNELNTYKFEGTEAGEVVTPLDTMLGDYLGNDYLQAIEISLKGVGEILDVYLYNDLDGDGSEEVLMLNTASKIVDWSIFGGGVTGPGSSVLNDTGITFDGNYLDGNNATCSSNIANPQDCHQGRDATHNDDSDGHAGFSFTKLDANGADLPASANSWSCVRDNVTGLVWEIKTTDGSIHDKGNSFRWGGMTALGSNFGTYYNDWDILVEGSNSASFCGFNDWRAPTFIELVNLLSLDRFSPAIDTDYFPNTPNYFYWASNSVSDLSAANIVGFGNGNAGTADRNNFALLRLVRSQ